MADPKCSLGSSSTGTGDVALGVDQGLCSFWETIQEGLLGKKRRTSISFVDMSPTNILHTITPYNSCYSTKPCHAGAINCNISKDPHPHPRHISPLCTRNGPIVHELHFVPPCRSRFGTWNLFLQNQWLCATSLEITARTITPSPSFQKSTFHPDKLSKGQKTERLCGPFFQQLCSEMLLLPERICRG